DAELDIGLGGRIGRVFTLQRLGAVAGNATREQAHGEEGEPSSVHARTCKPKVFEPSRTMVRSVTWPASCPQAASMSSPRVLRIVTINPRCMSSSLNFSIAAWGERRY